MDESAWVTVEGNDRDAAIVGGGALDLTNSSELWEKLSHASQTADSVVVDLTPAVFIDTAVLEYLAKASKTMLRRNKRLKVVATKDKQPLYVLQIVGFDSLMDIVVDEGEA